MMSDKFLTEHDYYQILNGERTGRHYSGNYFIVERAKNEKPTKKEVMIKEGVGLPPNLNEEYDDDERKIPPKKRKRKNNKIEVDSSFLRKIGYSK